MACLKKHLSWKDLLSFGMKQLGISVISEEHEGA